MQLYLSENVQLCVILHNNILSNNLLSNMIEYIKKENVLMK